MMRAEGRSPPPESLPPPVGPHPEIEDWLIRAFFRLSTCREIGMAVGPIPWSSIVDYADRAGLKGDSAETFTTIMMSLDHAYLADERARQKTEAQRHG